MPNYSLTFNSPLKKTNCILVPAYTQYVIYKFLSFSLVVNIIIIVVRLYRFVKSVNLPA